MEDETWLIGTGQMAVDYAKVLTALGVSFTVIGRGENNCKSFKEKTGIAPISGGIQEYINRKNSKIPKKAIIAVNVEELKNSCVFLINNHVREILLEKPGVAYPNEIKELSEAAEKNNAIILLAYNRRFYASVLKAEEMIKKDGGVTSFYFEFTEWSHFIRGMNKTDADFHNWFLGNSTHVVDLAFYLGGKPKEINAFTTGGLDWHPVSSIFVGAGISNTGALFSYHANWEAPGRWNLELLTKYHRLIFKPLEKLHVQEIGSVVVNTVTIDDQLDIDFKPGLYLQTKAFLDGDYTRFCDVRLQREMIEGIYSQMSGYN